ncbi:hypothetical protein [Longimicrobium sp.]|uniref:hypothetical protein n=1 Tax=Longimicrobium sp. TaxID=2029185 RepID=UPI002E378393|nr:hypothetical protein [Longimicrobium sp.]HEX6042054.1 hypothetical protein [Longimicrobium sp.]
MNVTPIRDPLAGEQVVGAQPRLAPTADDAGWQRRLNLYTGRALGDSALVLEQTGRAGRLAMTGRAWSHGVAAGLEVGLEAQLTSGGETRWMLHVAAGYGLTVRGEDVYLPRTVRVALDDLHVYLPARVLAPSPHAREVAAAEAEARRKALEEAQAQADAAAEAARAEALARMRAATEKARGLGGVLRRGRKPTADEEAAAGPMTAPRVEAATPEQVRAAALRLPLDAKVRESLLASLRRDEEHPLHVWRRGSMVKPLLPASTLDPIEEGGVPVGAGMPLRRPTVVMGEMPVGPLPKVRETVRMPRVAVLLLQPVEAELVGRPDPADPCELDPQDDAFADWQVADGVRLVLYAFPWEDRVDVTPPDTWRNRLAYEVFQAEAALGPGERLPWEYAGLPIGLVGFDDAGAPAWVDGYAVARDGGKPHRRTPLLAGVGDAYLWQARLKQFAEQVAEVDWSVADPGAEFARFAYLPPAGLLPRPSVDLENNTTWAFPQDYVVEAVPVPLEQLDAAIEASAPLDPFDLHRPDRVRVLVPVPQAYYEPRLLLDDEIDPQFGAEIEELTARRLELLRRREDLRNKAGTVFTAILAAPLDFGWGRPDPERLEDEGDVVITVRDLLALAPAEEDFGTRVEGIVPAEPDTPEGLSMRAVAVDTLREELLRGPLRPHEVDRLNVGVEPFVAELDARVRRADDHVDFSFLRVQSDIYRLRQLMLGTTAATRLATSPALAGIINSESAFNVRDQLLGYLEGVRAKGTGGAAGTASKPGQDAPGPATKTLVANTYFLKANTLNLGWNLGPINTAMQVAAKTAPAPQPAVASIAAASLVPQSIAAGGMDTPFRAGRYMAYTPVTRKPAPTEAVRLKAPIVGEAYDFRTVTVAERLDSPAANEAKSFAVLSRYEVLQGLAGLDIPLDDVMIPGFIKRDAQGNPERRTLRNAVGGGTPSNPTSFVWVREARPFGEVKNRLEALVLEENDPSNADESAFFSMAVELLDSTVAALRNVEGRIQLYRGAVDRARATLDELRAQALRVDARLKTVGDDLAETRHDLAVARALLEDEKQRVAAVNARRKRVLAEQVHFYAYQRPRLSAALLDAPARPLDPAFTQSPLPAALAGSEVAPPELRAMVEVLREAPLRFFRNAGSLLAGLDTLAVLRGTLESARDRARVRQAPVTLDALDARLGGRLGVSIARTLQAQAQVVALHRQSAAQMDLGGFGALNWARVRAEALRTLSLGDLIDAAHGRTAVDRAAAREVDDVLKVATALYRELGLVKPAVRLDWAEALSQYDQAADLHNLYALPRFGEIEYLDRREMQALVDWLYARIDPSQPEAAAMMSDVVRVCILLASHAPVNAVIAASVTRETEVRIGGTVEVAADAAQARVGMHVLLYDVAKRPVHAVVEDLTDRVAVARVVHAAAPSVTIAKDTRAQMGEEARLATHAAVAAGKPRIAALAQAKK